MKNTNKKTPSCLSNHNTLILISFFLRFILTTTPGDSSSVPAADNILLNCGSPSETVSFNGQNWTGDIGSKFLPSAYQSSSTISAVSDQLVGTVPQIPYMTARIFRSQFTYSFPISPGHKFIRLYFYPALYSAFNTSRVHFSVSTGRYTLLANFSASLTAISLKSAYFIKEFCVHVEGRRLNITFAPSPSTSNGYAFVNGIEIFSMPSNLYTRGRDVPLPFIGQYSPFFIDNRTALEFLYYINVAEPTFSFPEECTNMLGRWIDDSNYIFGAAYGLNVSADWVINYLPTLPYYHAPLGVYSSARTIGSYETVGMNYSLTWRFPIDSGFNYLVRLHFCEIQSEITRANQRVFKIIINNQTAENHMDVIASSGGIAVPMYRDYVVMVHKQYLWLTLSPNTESRPKYSSAILNGLEIIKLSDNNSNLAAHVRLEIGRQVDHAPIIIIVGGVLGGVVALFLLCYLVFRLHRRRNFKSFLGLAPRSDSKRPLNGIMSSIPSDLCRNFPFADIRAATNNFDESLIIGAGGFGKVYKGYTDGGATAVAIKRGNPRSHQGVHEFRNEIEMLSKLRHLHVVSLIGYCCEDREMILVYDYMIHGTLRDHLYKTPKPPLDWKERLKICIGAARGLHYLHTGSQHSIIHRDVKTTNILLDEKWVAKVSDFGLSKMGPTMESHTHVSTVVKGTFGYLDPEYYRRRKLTEKSDVYSFGVVLFEVLFARPAVNPVVEEEEQVSLAEWAISCYQNGTLDKMIDPSLRGQIAPECLMTFAKVAGKCLASRGIERPAMSDVLRDLQLALQLQCSIDASMGMVGGPTLQPS
ncbi:hypothetical protein HHK36_015527 [Tetracentron sinense]|uniref:Protein kinase domain-containing protein n=1 Tax=Tetracentron sinense TaxID=13715 RepID=A0A834Z5A0_TETSI|nr:hypothetical protein HHK36_015527 [Tetracentron sinense]